MIFFSHSSWIHILQLAFTLVCSCSEGLLTTEKHHLVPFSLLIFCILCLSIQIKYFFFLDTQGTFELKSVFRLLSLFFSDDFMDVYIYTLSDRKVANIFSRGQSRYTHSLVDKTRQDKTMLYLESYTVLVHRLFIQII